MNIISFEYSYIPFFDESPCGFFTQHVTWNRFQTYNSYTLSIKIMIIDFYSYTSPATEISRFHI